MDGKTFERGRFYIGRNGFPRFAGSASGVYFADTVQTEINVNPISPHALSFPGVSGIPIGDGAGGIEEAFIARNTHEEPRAIEAQYYGQYLIKVSELAQADRLRQRLVSYFAAWHPLFPFLDGAYVLQCFESALQLAEILRASAQGQGMGIGASQAFQGLRDEEALVLSAIMMAVFTIGGESGGAAGDAAAGTAGDGDADTSALPLFRGASHATMVAHLILGACQNSTINDIFAIQGLIAIELYLYTTRTLRPAMHLSGTITKLAYEAGLHRCPARFADTFRRPADRDIRQRVFYSLYILDRLLSAEFGIPLMLNDSDVDTCVPGAIERHAEADSPPKHPARSPSVASAPTPAAKRRRVDEGSAGGYDGVAPTSVGTSGGAAPPSGPSVSIVGEGSKPDSADVEARRRLWPCMSLVGVTRMMGKAMEAFNKSVKNRSHEDALHLRVELESWWNDIGLDDDYATGHPDPRHRFPTLFTCLYHQQQISLHRSALSLAPNTAQHGYALQTAITSARVILSTLARAFVDSTPSGDTVWWPGYVDMLFFSCLIMVYGARRDVVGGAGASPRLKRDLERAVRVFDQFSAHWGTLRAFTRTVQTFIQKMNAEGDGVGAEVPRTDGLSSTLFSVDPNQSLGSQQQQTEIPSDFAFDFDGLFELNPDISWAFHQSLPGSPVFPQFG